MKRNKDDQKRYLIVAEGRSGDAQEAKTMHGIIRYAPDPTVGVVDSARAGQLIDGIPVVSSVAEALHLRPTTAVVGVAPAGGALTDHWRHILLSAIEHGLDVEAGLHTFLADDPALSAAANQHQVELRDLRRPPDGLGVPNGDNLRHAAFVAHTVGSDCAIGKKVTALELDLEARRRGVASVFVPTGQTGVAIAGWGIAVDAVVADFVAGAAERLVVDGARRGSLLWVEGQGSLVHPHYSGVTVGLYHGAMPHALVLCHGAGATGIYRVGEHPIPPLAELVDRYERISLPARPARVCAIALNTAGLDEELALRAVEEASAETGLVADDPVRFGPARIVDRVLAEADALGWSRERLRAA